LFIFQGFDLLAQYGKDSIPVVYFPIDDFKTPKPGDFNYVSRLVDRLEDLLQKGMNVLVHCHAGMPWKKIILMGRYWENWVIDFPVGQEVFGATWIVGNTQQV
jgi:hypothetical protein